MDEQAVFHYKFIQVKPSEVGIKTAQVQANINGAEGYSIDRIKTLPNAEVLFVLVKVGYKDTEEEEDGR